MPKLFPRIALLVLLWLNQSAFAAGVQFSATMVQKTAGQTQTVRVYHGDQKMRSETTGEEQAISIIDLKARKMVVLIPGEKMYMEMPLGADTASWAADDKTREQYFDVKHLGTETVNGYLSDKYLMTPKKAGMEKSTTWIAQKLGYAVKSVGASYSMEMTQIKEGPQPAALFTIPAEYQKMPGMEDMLRGVMPR